MNASGLLLANCTDAQLRIAANVQLQYLMVYNVTSTSISPLFVDSDSTLTLLNAVFLGNSVTSVPQSNASLYASAVYLNGSARLEASGLVVQGNAQRFTPFAAPDSKQGSPAFTASVIATTEGCPAVVAHSVFVGNGVRRDGGAAAGSGTALVLNRNGASNYNISDCSITLYNNTFIGNMAQEWGGAVWVWGWQPMPVNITQNVFARNRVVHSNATRDCGDGSFAGWARGGAMTVMSGAGVSLSRNHWAGNHACMLGGALSVFNVEDVAIEGDVFEANSAEGGMGGAVVLQARESSRALINSVRFTGNAAQRGGALFVEGMDLDCKFTVFSGNRAKLSGGGLNCDSCRDVLIFQ
jgi:predicted outer membrane repeat protein